MMANKNITKADGTFEDWCSEVLTAFHHIGGTVTIVNEVDGDRAVAADLLCHILGDEPRDMYEELASAEEYAVQLQDEYGDLSDEEV